MSEVLIHHPDRDRTVKVPSSLFPGRLAAKGWVLADAPASAPEAPSADEKAALTSQLEAAGVDVDGRRGIKWLRAEAANLGTDEDLD